MELAGMWGRYSVRLSDACLLAVFQKRLAERFLQKIDARDITPHVHIDGKPHLYTELETYSKTKREIQFEQLDVETNLIKINLPHGLHMTLLFSRGIGDKFRARGSTYAGVRALFQEVFGDANSQAFAERSLLLSSNNAAATPASALIPEPANAPPSAPALRPVSASRASILDSRIKKMRESISLLADLLIQMEQERAALDEPSSPHKSVVEIAGPPGGAHHEGSPEPGFYPEAVAVERNSRHNHYNRDGAGVEGHVAEHAEYHHDQQQSAREHSLLWQQGFANSETEHQK
jgi:hypothetical protein